MKSEAEIMARIELLDLKRREFEHNAETARQANDGVAYLSAKGYAVQTSTEMAILAWCLEPSDVIVAPPDNMGHVIPALSEIEYMSADE